MSAALAARDWLRGLGRTAYAGGPGADDGTQFVTHDITGSDDTSDAAELYEPEVQFDVWADSYETGATESEWLRRTLAGIRREVALNGDLTALGAPRIVGPTFRPDRDTNRSRFILSATFTARRT